MVMFLGGIIRAFGWGQYVHYVNIRLSYGLYDWGMIILIRRVLSRESHKVWNWCGCVSAGYFVRMTRYAW